MSNCLLETGAQRLGLQRLCWGLTGAAGVAFAVGLLTARYQVWPNLLLMCFFLLGVGLAGTLFLALTRVTGARWSDAIRPVPAAMARTLPLVAVMLGIVVIVGMYNYPWQQGQTGHGASFWFKNWWLSPTFFAARSVGYLVLLSLFAVTMGRARATSGRLSALFLIVFAIVFSLAGIDWIMSLSPEWFSTMFGVYQFSGIFLSGLATITLVAVLLQRLGPWRHTLTEDHLRDLGILTFSFSCFWMYIWLSQYMLIWYANIPEETFYYVARVQGAWGPLFVANICLNWVIPFVVLTPRTAKRNATVMMRVAIVILVGRWLDLYLMILPSEHVTQPSFGFCEIGSILGTVGLLGVMMVYALRKGGIAVE